MGQNKPVIAVKFCGGCNPTYDRGTFFERLKGNLGDKITLVPHDYPSPDGVVVICGCERVCPVKHFNPEGYRSFTVIDRAAAAEETAAQIIKEHI